MDSNRLVDNSTLEKLHSCTTAVVLERSFGFRPLRGNFYLDAGTAIHAGMEHFLLHGNAGVADVVREKSAHLPFDEPDLPPAYTPDNLAKIGQHIADTYTQHPLPWKVVAVEKAFRVKLTEDIWINGKYDILVQEGSGLMADVDFKTTGKMDKPWRRKQINSSQRMHYWWGISRLFGQSPATSYVFGIHIREVPSSTRKCSLHGVTYAECGMQHLEHDILPVEMWPAKVDAWRRDAVVAAERWFQLRDWVGEDLEKVASLPMEGIFNGSCYNCPFNGFCHMYGKNPDVVENIFKREAPFSPEVGVEVLVEGEV